MKALSRYMLFAYYHYYPSGGMGDYQESFKSVEDALSWLNEVEGEGTDWEYRTHDFQEAHVYDVETKTTIYLEIHRDQWRLKAGQYD